MRGLQQTAPDPQNEPRAPHEATAQLPEMQVPPTPQVWPQPPQSAGSVSGSTQTPLQGIFGDRQPLEPLLPALEPLVRPLLDPPLDPSAQAHCQVPPTH